MSIFPRPLKKVLDKVIPFSQEDKVPTFNLGTGTADNTTFLRGDGTWSTPGSSGYVPYIGATSDVDLGTYKITADAVEFSLTPVNAPAAGQIAYDGASGALAYLLNSSNVISRIGQTMHAYVHNAEAVTITKGQAVYLYQASGNKASVKLAYNTSDATSAKTFGLAAEDIGAGQNGMVICQGVLDGLNTGMYTAGDTLYLGNTAGSYTNVKPYAPNHLVYIVILEMEYDGYGQIYVKTQNGYELDEIHDVDLITTPPVSGNVLTYNGSLWVPQASASSSNPRTIDLVTGSNITGVLAMSLSASLLIPANTITSPSVIEVISRAIRVSGTAATIYHRMYINTSNTLTGATLLGVFNGLTATNYFSQGIRQLFIDTSTNQLTVVNAGATIGTDYVNTGANTVLTYNPANNYYIIFGVQLFNVGDTARIQFGRAVLYE